MIYDGIHYDPLVKEGEEGTVLQRVFHISNDGVLVQALELAKDAYEVGTHTIAHALIPYSGKLSREKTFANWRKRRFSQKKLSQIARWCHRQKTPRLPISRRKLS